MNKLTFLIVLVFFTTLSFGQQKESILFDSDSYRLTPFQTEKINVLLYQLEGEQCSITISGHTDSDADDTYNLALSQNRVSVVKKYITTIFRHFTIADETFHGEENPLNDNSDNLDKANNRRVEITVVCQQTKPTEKIGDIWPILNKIKPAPTQLHFDGAKGGAFDLKNGVRISIAPKTFTPGQINLQVSECLTIGDGFAYGLTTQSNQTGNGLESSGMYRIQAFQNDRLVQNINSNDITIYIPITDSGFQTFDAVQEGKYTEWTTRTGSNDKYLKPYGSLCALTKCDITSNKKTKTRYITCNFFWCKIKSFFSRSYNNEKEQFVFRTMSVNPDFRTLYDIYKKDLDKAFENEFGFAQFVASNSYTTILDKMNELFPRFTTDIFYAMKMPNYAWVNCDRFGNYKNLTSLTINEKMHNGKDIRLYFKSLNCVMSPNGKSPFATKFKRIPVGKIATLVILKKVNDVMLMSSQDFRVGEKPKINFKEVRGQDLKKIFYGN
ncbi:MAG: hypothetical protein ACI9JN_000821 [Bacteroidia bacterium]|jgi:hypothetical protein